MKMLPCASILQVKALDPAKKRLEYFVENQDNQLIMEQYDTESDIIESCISPTGEHILNRMHVF